MNWLSAFALVVTLIYLYLGTLALRGDPRGKLNRLFFLFSLSLAVWGFSYSFVYSGSLEKAEELFLWYKISSLGWCLFPAFAFHFALVLTGLEQKKKCFSYLLPLVYLAGAFQVYLVFVGMGFLEGFAQQGEVIVELVRGDHFSYHLYNVYLLGLIGGKIIIIYGWGRYSGLQRQKKQASYIIYSALATLLLGLATNLLLPGLGYQVPALAVLASIFYAVGMWISIERYKIMSLHSGMAAEQILEKVKDYIMLVDPQGHIIKVNQQVAGITGLDVNKVEGVTLEDIFQEKDIISREFSGIGGGLNPGEDREMHLLSVEGQNVPVRVSCSPVWDTLGDVLGGVIICQDLRETRQLLEYIQEREEVEAVLRESYEKLKELDKLKTDFLSTVSHELRTPLTSVLGFAKIIKKRFSETIAPRVRGGDRKVDRAVRQMMENLDIVVAEGERLTGLINNVLDIARIEAGEVNWDQEPLSMDEVISRAFAATASLFEQKGLQARMEVEKGLPQVIGDRDRLVQVVINLLSNGVKFTDQGSITCRAWQEEDHLFVSVIDTGIGIQEEYLEEVFNKFKQVGDIMTGKPQGTGLGLPICKEIVEHHGGSIKAESRPGEGSAFTFTLPLLPEGNAP